MAWNSYFPTGYQPMYYPQTQPQMPTVQNNPQAVPQAVPQTVQPQSNGGGLTWVQGEAGAKSYLVAPNTTVLLMDSENDVFYLKSTDASGMPMPLRVFAYKEQKSADSEPKLMQRDNYPAYVTKDEFEAFKGQIEAFMNSPSGRHEKAEVTDGE